MTTQKRMNVSSLLLFLIFPTLYFLWSGSWYAKFCPLHRAIPPVCHPRRRLAHGFSFSKAFETKNLFVYLYICIFAYWRVPHPLGPNELDHLSPAPRRGSKPLNGSTTTSLPEPISSPNTGTMACRWISRRMEKIRRIIPANSWRSTTRIRMGK